MNERWRVVSLTSEDSVATIAFRDSCEAERDYYVDKMLEIARLGGAQGDVAVHLAHEALGGYPIPEGVTDGAGLRHAMENALAARTWDQAQAILAAALTGHHKNHELSGDCWCRPRIEQVAPA